LEGEDSLIRKKPIAYNHPRKIPQEVLDKIIELEQHTNLAPLGSHGILSAINSLLMMMPHE
jgi:hypothetical protein